MQEKVNGHKGLAYNIISDIGLGDIYYFYEERLTAPDFLTYCGYVLVDETQEGYREPKNIFEDFEEYEYVVVIYCSAVIDKAYIEELKNIYPGEENEFGDTYKDAETDEERRKIDQIIERIKKAKEAMEKRKETQLDGNER